MSFAMPPRSRSPVFSISTEPEQTYSLRAQIEAAESQQKYARRHNAKPLRDSVSHEPRLPRDIMKQHDYTTYTQRTNTNDTMTDILSVQSPKRLNRGIGGTIKGELNSAKELIKSASKKQLQRLRTRATRSSTSKDQYMPYQIMPCFVGSRFSGVDRPIDAARYSPPSMDLSRNISRAVLELSSDPPRAQLEDTQTLTSRPAISHKAVPSSYPQNSEATRQGTVTSPSGGAVVALCKKEYSCDNCQQHLNGQDFYNFCPMCDPCDRVLCMGCASRGGCWRHGQETMSVLTPPSLCGSPAPSYDHQYSSVEPCSRTPAVHKNVIHSHVDIPTIPEHAPLDEDSATIESSTSINIPKPSASRRHPDIKPAFAAQLQHDLLREVSSASHTSSCNAPAEKSIADREAVLRDQQVAIREQQVFLREEAFVLRERESILRERDALSLRNLQTFALEALARGQHIGSQFVSSKGHEYDGKDHLADVQRSKSTSSRASDISLAAHAQEFVPRESLSKIVASAETFISGAALSDKNIRACADKRKKSDESSTKTGLASMQPELTTDKQRSKSQRHSSNDQDGQEDDGNGDLTPSKRQKKDDIDQNQLRRNFACPYCKNDAQRYSSRNLFKPEMKYRNCATHYLPNIPRVKQHLQRVHWRPDNHCPRCFEVFKSPGELQDHFRCLSGCTGQECPFPEKMDTDQRRQIHVKRPNTPPEVLWYDIYKVLFPGTPLPDSPYADEETLLHPSSAAPSMTSSDEAAQILHQVFNEGLNQHADSFDQTLRDLLNRVLEESMSTVFSKITMSATPSPGAQISRTPSIVVSPVTPSLPKKVRVQGPTRPNESSRLSSSHTAAVRSQTSQVSSEQSAIQSVPQLQKPDRQLWAPALNPVMAAHTSHAMGTDVSDCRLDSDLRMPAPIKPDAYLHAPRRQHVSAVDEDAAVSGMLCTETLNATDSLVASKNQGLVEPVQYDVGAHVREAGFDWQVPSHFTEDQSYDEECNSFRMGDDRYAMEEMIQVQCCTKPGKAIYSPVDSGYGSGNSMHPRSDLPSVKPDQDGHDVDMVNHDTTFMQHYHEWQSSDEQQQSLFEWETHIGRAM